MTVAFFLFSLHGLFSQLSVTNNNLAISLAQKIVGNGITITNAFLNGGAYATGTFSYSGSHLGVANGIILTTGTAMNAANPGSYFCNVNNGSIQSDPDVIAMSPQAKYDVCILEFDFIPLCDTLKIKYVFGSEEYPKAIYQTYNDVFAIFLSGPKPGGGSYNSQNIATLPNGYTPVSIDSVNAGWPIGTNASHFNFYVDNYSSPNNDIAYNGYTIPVTSKAALITCSSYHLKIAIADGGNALYDSGVFIEGSSLACGNAPVISSAVASNCSNTGTVSVHVSNYSGTPSYTWIPGNLHSDTLKNVAAGTYICFVDLPGVCGNYSVSATISAQPTLSVNGGGFLCKGNSTQLIASGVSSYSWVPAAGLNNNTVANPIASPSVTTVYSAIGTASNGCSTVKSVTVTVGGASAPAAFNASTYFTSIESSVVQFTAASGPSSFYWNFGDGTTDTIAQPTHDFSEPGTYIVSLTVTDTNNCSETVAREIIVNDILPDLVTFYAPDAFTPNNDGVNDVFQVKGVGWDPSKFTLDIYNKWGRIIYTTNDPRKGWDGKEDGRALEADVYVWRVNLKVMYKKEHTFLGKVALVR